MFVLFVADTHGKLMQRDVNKVMEGKTIDLIVFLGDNTITDVEVICEMFPETRKIGVLGNHNTVDGDVFKYFDVENINLKKVEINNITFCGYGGSIKYKNENLFVLHTQKQAHEEMKALTERTDVFITHDKPKLEMNCREVDKKINVQKSFLFFKKTYEQIIKEKEYFYEEGISANAHEGTIAIGDYIKEKKPSYHFYGHLHTPSETMIGNTISKCIYGLEFVEIKA